MPENTPAANISAEQLKEILATVIAEVKKPNAVEQRELDRKEAEFEQAQEDRVQLAGQVMQQAAEKKAQQAMCSHMRRDGSTRAVYIQNGNYMLCQLCHDVIRPETRPQEFNKLFQMAQPAIFA